MGKKRKSGLTKIKPDEYFSSGPFEMARWGKNMVMRSRMSDADHKASQILQAKMLPEIISEIDKLILSIADRISRLPADRLLHRGWWEFAGIALMQGGAAVEDVGALRMIDYVQSVIASISPSAEKVPELSEEDWTQLQTDIQSLFERITLQYQICLTAARRVEDPQFDMNLEEFRFRAEGMWMHVRGKRYQPHEVIALGELLAPHSEIFEQLFGIGAEKLTAEFGKILTKLTRGAADSMLGLMQLHQDSIPRMEMLAKMPEIKSQEEFVEKLWEDSELASKRDTAMGEVFGLDLFDVSKVTELPPTLIAELTWNPGEESSFFAPGEFAGWPLRIWPTMLRPFIRLDDRALCFDMWSLFDNIYRALQKIVIRIEPSYRELWNQRQKEVTEELPFIYFEKILPGMRSFHSVNYQWKSGIGKAQWHECDGVIIYDDHLFVLEVKAGAFTYTSPANDLAAHLSSLKSLLQAPATQGSRFLDYLESADEVGIADEAHNEVARLQRSSFRHVTVVAITLDAFTELAARVQHLKSVGIDVGSRPVWALSIDDLRVYADMFKNPLAFLHFVEQRMVAAHNDHINLNDEIDHFGLYLEHNNYSQFASELNANSNDNLNFTGFRTPVDEFYTAMTNGEITSPPTQEMPPRIAEILSVLSKSKLTGRSQLASFLLDAASDLRNTIAEGIDNQLDGNRRLKRQRPLLIAGEHAFTLCTYSPDVTRDAKKAVEYTRSIIAANNESTRLLIELEYDGTDTLLDVQWQYVGLQGLSLSNIAKAHSEGQRLKGVRIAMAKAKGKIRVNDPCPCGSGKKYKKCCRP